MVLGRIQLCGAARSKAIEGLSPRHAGEILFARSEPTSPVPTHALPPVVHISRLIVYELYRLSPYLIRTTRSTTKKISKAAALDVQAPTRDADVRNPH